MAFLLLLVALLTVLTSMIQNIDPNAGASFGNDAVFGNNNRHCSGNGGNAPIRYQVIGEDFHRYCPWPAGQSWFRGIFGTIIFFYCMFLMDRYRRPTPASNSAAIWRKPKLVLLILLLASFGPLIVWFIALIQDSVIWGKSRTWCNSNDTPTDSELPIQHTSCGMAVFGLIVWLDLVNLLLWVVFMLLQFVQRKWYSHWYEEVADDVELEGKDLSNRIVSLDKELGINWDKGGK